MTDPATLDEYNTRTQRNYEVTGGGLETSNTFPCPFCAAPEWAKVKIVEFGPPLEPAGVYYGPEYTCDECGRSGQFRFERGADGSAAVEIVQTGGEDPPDYLPAPTRQDAVAATQ